MKRLCLLMFFAIGLALSSYAAKVTVSMRYHKHKSGQYEEVKSISMATLASYTIIGL